MLVLVAGIGAVVMLSNLSSEPDAETASKSPPAMLPSTVPAPTTSRATTTSGPPPTTTTTTPPAERFAALRQAALIRPEDLGPGWVAEPSEDSGDGLFSFASGVHLSNPEATYNFHSFATGGPDEFTDSSMPAFFIRDSLSRVGDDWTVDNVDTPMKVTNLLDGPPALPVLAEFALDYWSESEGRYNAMIFRYTWHTHGVVSMTKFHIWLTDRSWLRPGGIGRFWPEIAEIYRKSDAAVAARLASI